MEVTTRRTYARVLLAAVALAPAAAVASYVIWLAPLREPSHDSFTETVTILVVSTTYRTRAMTRIRRFRVV
jgi:hypothetical protein